MTTLLQISDPHFGTERPAVVAALLALARTLRPTMAVVSGDITQRARRAEFDAAKRFLDQLQCPVLCIPGNHDIPLFNLPARLLSPYGGYTRVLGSELEPSWDDAAMLVLGLNTTRPHYRKDGEVSHEQVLRVAARLRRAHPRQLRVVVTHQPVHVIREKDIENVLRGHEHAVRAWSEAGADIILGGHIHLPYIRMLGARFPDLPRRVWAIQAGTAVSERVRDGVSNSVNVIRHAFHEAHTCTVERWDYQAGSSAFEKVTAEVLDLDRSDAAAEPLGHDTGL